MIGTLVRSVDGVSAAIGRTVSWLTLGMVIVQFALVLLRYVFGVGAIAVQEGITWMHGLVFLCAAAWTLSGDGHVRVDIFYREASARTQAWVDLCGTILFLWPVCYILASTSWPYVRNSWKVLEGSTETAGLPGVFLLKSMILVMAFLLALQGGVLALRSLVVVRGRTALPPPPHSPGR